MSRLIFIAAQFLAKLMVFSTVKCIFLLANQRKLTLCSEEAQDLNKACEISQAKRQKSEKPYKFRYTTVYESQTQTLHKRYKFDLVVEFVRGKLLLPV